MPAGSPLTGPVAPVPNPLFGMGLKVVSVVAFVGMFTFIKAAGVFPAGQIVFFRSFFAIVPIMAFFAVRGELGSAFYTAKPIGHAARGLAGVVSMGFGFFALTRLPLPEAITLGYAQPLLIVVFSAVFLGEVVRAYRWTAVAVGFVGVVIVSWPKLTLFGGQAMDRAEMIGVLAALLAAGLSAVALLLVRSLVHTERTSTIVIWFSLTASAIALLTLPFGWQMPTAWQATCLIAAGFCGGIGQILMTEAYRHAEASVVAPFEYTSLIFGILVGYFAFGDVPTIHVVAGGAIVVGAGIFIIWREHRLGVAMRRRKVLPPQ